MGWNRSLEPIRFGYRIGTSGSRTNVSLNSAYSHLVSGAAVGIRINSQFAQPIDELYIFLDATTGTRANVTMSAKLYDCASSGTQPGSTLRATSTVAALPGTDDNWIRFVFPSPYTPTVGEWLFATFENLAAAPATDFPQLLNASAAAVGQVNFQTAAYSSMTGFSTAGTFISEFGHVVKQGTEIYGMPYTLIGSVATFTGRRGIVFGPEWKKFIGNRICFTSGATTNAIQIFELSTAPTGTPVFSKSITGLDTGGNCVFDFDFSTLNGAGPWVLCVNTTGNVTVTGLSQIEGYSAYPAIFDAFYDYAASCPSVIQSGSAWVVDNSRMGGMYVELVSVASTPASGGLLSQGFII